MPSFRGNHADSPPSLRPSLPPSMIRPIPHSSHLAIRHRSDGDYAWRHGDRSRDNISPDLGGRGDATNALRLMADCADK